MFSLSQKTAWHRHLSLFSEYGNGGFGERRRVFRGPEVPPDATPEQRDKYFDEERLARATPIKGDHAGVRQILEEDEKERQRNSPITEPERQRIYGEVLQGKAYSVDQRTSRIKTDIQSSSASLEGIISSIPTPPVIPSVFNNRGDFHWPITPNTKVNSFLQISQKLGNIEAEITRINNIPDPTPRDIQILDALYEYRAMCRLTMQFARLASIRMFFDRDRTGILAYQTRITSEINGLGALRGSITETIADITIQKGVIQIRETENQRLEEAKTVLESYTSSSAAISGGICNLFIPPLSPTPTPADLQAALTHLNTVLIPIGGRQLAEWKRELAEIQQRVFLKETLLNIQIERAKKEKQILTFIQGLPATLTQTHIDTFVAFTKDIHNLNKRLKEAKRSTFLPDEGSIQRETLNRILDQEEDLLSDAQDALGLQLMANGVDPVLIYNLGNFGRDGTFRTSFANLINPFRTTPEEALREAQDKTREILRKNGVPQDVEDFFLELVVVHGDISPADLEKAFKDDKESMAIIVNSIIESTIPAARNPSITPSPITLPIATAGSILEKINNSIINRGREYIDAKRNNLTKLQDEMTTYEETSFEQERGFRIRSARDNYIRAKEKFSALGFLHTVWFDESGKFVYATEKAEEIKTLLKQTIPGFRPDSGFTSVDEFIGALFDSTNAKHNDAKYMMTALRDDITQWEQQEDGRINAQKTGMDYLTNNAQNIFEKGAQGIQDMFTSGEPAQMAAAGILIYMFVKGFTHKKFGIFFKGAAGLWAADYFAKEAFNFDALDELGITSALSPITGSAPKAWEETLRRRGGVTEFEQYALGAEGMKTRALIALGEVPLQELLDWHQAVSNAKTADSDVQKLLEEEIPDSLKSNLGKIARSGDKFEASTVAFGLLSLSLRESASREGYEGVSGEHAPDIARMLVRAKYFHEKESGFDDIKRAEEKKIINNVLESYQQENHGEGFTFGMFVEKEIGPSEVELSKLLNDTWTQRMYTQIGESGVKVYNRLKDGWGQGIEALQETIIKIKDLHIPNAFEFISDMIDEGFQLAASAGNEINLLWQTHKVSIIEIASGTWGVLVDGFLLPFKAGIEIFKVVKDNIPTIMSIINTTKTIVETSIEKLFGLNESREQVSINSAEDLYAALEDLKLDKAVIEAYGLPTFMTQTINGKVRNTALLQLCDTIFIDHRTGFINKLTASMTPEEVAKYNTGGVKWTKAGIEYTSGSGGPINFTTLQHIPRGVIGKYFLTDIWMVSLANRTVDQAAKIFAKVPSTIKTIGGMDSNILLTAANEMANGIFAIREGRPPNPGEKDPFGQPNNPTNANNTFLQEYAPWLDKFTPVGGPNLAKIKTFASDVEGIINGTPDGIVNETLPPNHRATDMARANYASPRNTVPTDPILNPGDLQSTLDVTNYIWTTDRYNALVEEIIASKSGNPAVNEAFRLFAKDPNNFKILFQKAAPFGEKTPIPQDHPKVYGGKTDAASPNNPNRNLGFILKSIIRNKLSIMYDAIQVHVMSTQPIPAGAPSALRFRFRYTNSTDPQFHLAFQNTVNNPSPPPPIGVNTFEVVVAP
jgi:hypothetical protein